MSILNSLNPVLTIVKGIFPKGVAQGAMDVLAEAGVKEKLTPSQQQAAQDALQNWELEMTKQDNLSIQTINSTMQSEANSEHWMQWAWRPFFGFTAAFVIIYNYIVAPLVHLQPVTIPGDVWSTILVVVGASAVTRGIQNIKGTDTGNPGTKNT